MLTQLFSLVFSSQSFRTARETQAKTGTLRNIVFWNRLFRIFRHCSYIHHIRGQNSSYVTSGRKSFFTVITDHELLRKIPLSLPCTESTKNCQKPSKLLWEIFQKCNALTIQIKNGLTNNTIIDLNIFFSNVF